VTITYVVTITSAAPTITSQGTVSGGNFSNVLTTTRPSAARPTRRLSVELPPVVSDIAKSGNEDTQITSPPQISRLVHRPEQRRAHECENHFPAREWHAQAQWRGRLAKPGLALANLGNLTFDPAANFFGATSFGWKPRTARSSRRARRW